MTKYALTDFDCTTGILEQILLICIALRMANRTYLNDVIKKDYIDSSIDWNKVSSGGEEYIDISIILPISNYARNILKDAPSLDRRIDSFSTASIGGLGLYRKDSYGRRSYPVRLPEYLTELGEQNILERRLAFLCLQMQGVLDWTDRWNYLAKQWIYRKYLSSGIQAADRVLPLDILESRRDLLIVELESDLPVLFYVPLEDVIPLPIEVADIETAEEEANYYLIQGEDSGGDPASGSYVPNSLLESLQQGDLFGNGSNNQFGSFQQDSATSEPNESPTLNDC